MIIKKLTINNFRNYFGSSTFNLTTSKNHNIVLIGGQNGAGKTSLADAIRLCLYGHWVDGRILSEAKYQEYLENVCSSMDGVNEFFVSLELTLDEENPPIEIDVTRKFTRKGSKFSEKLILKKAGSEVELIDESYWSYYIEKLISPTVSRYFFFDGERVRDTISSPESKEYLINAVNDISGISELNNLGTDLLEVKKRILSKTTKTSSLERINQLHARINDISSDIEEIDSQIGNQREFIKDYQDKRNELNQERSRIVGSSESKRAELNQRIDELKDNFEDVNLEVIDFCFNRLMYRLADRSIVDTVNEAKAENSGLISKYSIDTLIRLRDGGDVSAIIGLSEDKSREIVNKLIDSLSSEEIEKKDVLLDLTLSRVEQIDSMRTSLSELDTFMERFRNREFYIEEIKKYEKKRQKAEDNSLVEIDSKIQEFTTQIEVGKIEISKFEAQRKNLEIEMDIQKANLKKEERGIVLEDVDRAAVDNIELVLKTISQRSEIVLLKSKQTLVKKINEMYHILKNTKDMVKEIRLSDSFELQLINFKDQEINKEFISEGEKGILMYSVVYGLHSLSTMRFPVIIDSPLGRMDTLHVNHLATKLFPTVSDQVILLSHDREVIGENHDLIKDYVARNYLISKFGEPKVKEGYFE